MRWIVGLTCALWALGCNTTEGECWYRGQGGDIGSGVDGSFGVAVGAGVGGRGDYYGPQGEEPSGEESPPACSESDLPEAEGDHGKTPVQKREVFCREPDHGQPCAERCQAKGVGCAALAVHPKKPDAGIGKLFVCNNKPIGFICGYAYPNGDSCHYFFGFPLSAWCVYTGGK